VASIRASESAANAEAALGEIEPVANGPSHAVVAHPVHQRLIHTALINQILQQTAHGIIDKCRDNGSFQTETTLQAASYVVFAAAFINVEPARGRDSSVTRIEAQHHFAEGDKVPPALIFRFDDHSLGSNWM
jgi:hypothetical protein